MEALRRGDLAHCFEHTAPGTRSAIGSAAGFERILRKSKELSPLIGCSRWHLLGSLPLTESSYTVRVRVLPAYASAAPFAAAQVAPIDYTWFFRKDGPQQQWMTEEIVPDFDAPPLPGLPL